MQQRPANVENLVLIGRGDLNGVGNSGANRLTGTAGNNTLNGGAGADTLIGGAGHDVLRGAEGSDILIGGAGDDFLMGGGGRDRLTGGAGADHFVFEPAAGMVGRDVIADFSRVQGDKIDLSRIDANTGVGGNQAFDFIGSGVFSGEAGELRSQLTKTSLIVLGDIDGDRRADFSIELALKEPLFHSDFLL